VSSLAIVIGAGVNELGAAHYFAPVWLAEQVVALQCEPR